MATTPAQQGQQHQRSEGNNASRTTWQQCQCNKGNKDAIAKMPKMHQRCQHNKGDNASVTWATMPSQQFMTVAVIVVVIIIVAWLCLSSSPRLKRN
jgi:hypothetical protein